jgi:hypothetical protein
MSSPVEFTAAEISLVEKTLHERYGELVRPEPVDVELKLNPESSTLTSVPALYWMARDAEFVLCKVAPDRFRAQFFYSAAEQYGTGRTEYDNLGDCIVSLLQVQSDEERSRLGVRSGMTGADMIVPGKAPSEQTDSDDYQGPVVV